MVPNEFWLLKDRLEPLNESTPEVSLALTVKPLSFWWWQLQLQMEQSFSLQQATGLTQASPLVVLAAASVFRCSRRVPLC